MPATLAQEPTLDVLSILNGNDEPVLANCSLSIGDLTLEFKNGRSRIPRSAAPSVARCPQVTIPGYTGPVAEAPPNVAAGAESETEVDRVEAAREHLREEGIEVPSTQRVWVGETAIDLPVEQARALLAKGQATGEQPTSKTPHHGKAEHWTPERTAVEEAKAGILPDGFEALTDDGHPRCYARKGDGTQCSNATVEGCSCGLPAHKAQLDGAAG